MQYLVQGIAWVKGKEPIFLALFPYFWCAKKEDQHAGRGGSGVSGDSHSCPFLGMKASASCSGIIRMDFFVPFAFPNFRNRFFNPFPFPNYGEKNFIPGLVPNFGNGFFSYHFRPRILGMELSIPVTELPNVILQYPQCPWKGWGTGVSLFGQCKQAYIIFLERLSLTELNGRN